MRRVAPSAPPVELYTVGAHRHHPHPHPPTYPFASSSSAAAVVPNFSPPPSYPGPPLLMPAKRTHFATDADSIYQAISDDDDDEEEEDVGPGMAPNKAARFSPKSPNPRKMHKRRKANPMYYTKRGCTDVFCCCLFMLFIVGWFFVAVIGFMYGNPERLIHPVDSEGRRCGYNRVGSYDLTSKPYLYFFDITACISYTTLLSGCPTKQVCVEECPKHVFSYLQLNPQITPMSEQQFLAKVQADLICTEYVDKSTLTDYAHVVAEVNQHRCAKYAVPSAPVLGRCLPQVLVGAAQTIDDLQKTNGTLDSITNYIKQQIQDDPSIPTDGQINSTKAVIGDLILSEGMITKIVADLSQSWWQILTLIFIAGISAFVWTVVMRLLGSFIIWTSIGLIVLGLSAGCGYCWLKWKALHDAGAVDDFSFQPIITLYFEMPTTWLVFAIGGSVILAVVLLILLCVASRIRLGIAMIEESSKAVANMMSTLVFPLLPFVLHVAVFAIWGSIAIWIASMGEENCRLLGANATLTMSNPSCACTDVQMNSEDPNRCVFVNVTRNTDQIFWFQAYNLFGFFWMTCFVTALGQIALAGAFASHYWAVDKSKDLPRFPVLRALSFAIKYNLGSLAFGSLIIALVKMVRAILDYLDKKSQATQSEILKYVFMLLKCCFWCLEVFLKFLTKNAFIMMAIYGKNFFTSAKDSFLLLSRNCIRVIVIDKVTSFLLFIGKAIITIGIGVVGFYWFSGHWVIEGIPKVELYYYFVPIIIVMAGSYFVADLFFDVYEMAVDTTFICFLEDSEQNDGSVEKPYFMSRNLLRILGKENESTTSSSNSSSNTNKA